MTPALMNGQSFVVQCDATDAEMRQFLKKCFKISTERRCHVIDDQSNIAMVEAGLGISIMPQMLLRDCKAAIKIYPIEPEEDRVVGLAVQRPAAMAPAVEQMFQPHRGLLQADRAEMSRTPLYYTIKQSVCGAWTVFLLRKSDCISVQNPLYLEKQAGFMQKP
ncbi:hypothetical protein [Faecalibacterium hattorii]|uniref:hypothetical protein n=1 Tax=Faecalibacterium hattorii TaxID=2935520 RepID=UPI003AAC2760